MEHRDLIAHDLDELRVVAAELAGTLKIGDIVCLEGEMGVGKTAFTKCLVASLMEANDNISENSANESVASPTFNIVHNYGTPDLRIWHYDLYRVDHMEELYELGLEQAMSCGITIIEWPHIAYPALPSDIIIVQLDFNGQSDARKIRILRNTKSNQ